MKSPSEIKKGLRHCSEDGCKGCNYKSDCDMADGFSVLAYDALAYIQQLEAELDAPESNKFQYETGFLKGFEAAYPKWISVKERLPEVDMGVLCVAQTAWGPEVTEGYFWKNSQMISPIDEGCACDKVTHWMPLPEPPRKQDADHPRNQMNKLINRR